MLLLPPGSRGYLLLLTLPLLRMLSALPGSVPKLL
jgi:hypothetical protein